MRVAMAGFLHETNTFAPIRADLAAFRAGGGYVPLVYGADMPDALRGVNLGMAGALSVAEAWGWEVVPILWAGAIPSAHVTRDAFETIAGEIVERIAAAGPLDGVFLDLHGAMVAEHLDDGEGEVARRVRDVVGPAVPMTAALDLHGNISEAFAETMDLFCGFRTYPHVDMAETGGRAAEHLHALMNGRPRPARSFRRLPYMVPIPAQTSDAAPADTLYADLAAMEQDDVLSASLFMGFPAADIPDCGPTAIAFALSQDAADSAADRIAAAYLAAEDRFDIPTFDADAAVATAMQSPASDGPVVIADTQDNPGAGGVSATTGLLRALVRSDAQDAAIGLIVDPATARQAHDLGEGAVGRFHLGGHPALHDDPLECEATVETISDGKVHATGPYYGGKILNLGPSACLRIGGVRVVVSSGIAQMADRAMFAFVGIDPAAQSILVLKSSAHFRADFSPIASDILIACAPGPMPFDPGDLPFTRLRPGLRLSPNGPEVPAARTAEMSPAQ